MSEKTEAEEIAKMSGLDVSALSGIKTPVVNVSNFTQLKSLEPFMESPISHRARFSTVSVSQFIAYCKNNNNLPLNCAPTIYIDGKLMSAKTIFDHGDMENPCWGDFSADLNLEKTSDFQELLNNLNSVSQQDIVDFFIDYEDNIAFFDKENKSIAFNVAINSFRSVSVTNTKQSDSDIGEGFNSKKSISESTEIASGKNIIPYYFSFDCDPYNGSKNKTFNCRISAKETEPNKISFNSRIIKYEKIVNSLREELKDRIMQELGDYNIYLGSIIHENSNIRSGS